MSTYDDWKTRSDMDEHERGNPTEKPEECEEEPVNEDKPECGCTVVPSGSPRSYLEAVDSPVVVRHCDRHSEANVARLEAELAAERERFNLLTLRCEDVEDGYGKLRAEVERLRAELARLREEAEKLPALLVRRVAELPYRTSPEDRSEALLVTAKELEGLAEALLEGMFEHPKEP